MLPFHDHPILLRLNRSVVQLVLQFPTVRSLHADTVKKRLVCHVSHTVASQDENTREFS